MLEKGTQLNEYLCSDCSKKAYSEFVHEKLHCPYCGFVTYLNTEYIVEEIKLTVTHPEL